MYSAESVVIYQYIQNILTVILKNYIDAKLTSYHIGMEQQQASNQQILI